MISSINKKLKYWYIPLILGIGFIILGIWTIVNPLYSTLGLAIFFSVGFICLGLIEMFYSIVNRKWLKSWTWHLAGGIITFLLGIILIKRPELTALLLSLSIGFWLLFRSIMYIVSSVELKNLGIKNWGWTLILGIIGVCFSFILIWNPILIGIGIAMWMGLGLLILGLINIILGLSIQKAKDSFHDYVEIKD